VAAAQAVTLEKCQINVRLDVDQRLVNPDHIGLAPLRKHRALGDEGITTIHWKVVFGLALTGKFHGNVLVLWGKEGRDFNTIRRAEKSPD